MDRIAVLIPCYNEEKTIARVVSDFQRVLPDAVIYVYDNNSTDATVQRAEAQGAVIRREPRQGKGNVMRTMLREIDADCYLMVDGDDTYSARLAGQMCREVLENNADLVIGDRLSTTYFEENKRVFHNSGNRLVRFLVNTVFHGDIKDVMSGYRALSPVFVKTFPVLSKGFEIETEMTVHALDKNMRIVQVPVEYKDRPEGSESKLRTFSDGLRILRAFFRMCKDYRPLPFFSVFAALFAILSACLFALKCPFVIVSAFIMLAALLSLCCGLILDAVNKRARQDFEFKLNLIQMYRRK